jgi:hypothetical protein
MDPDTLEMFLFLKANKDLWENLKVMQEIIDQLKAANNGIDDDDKDEEEEEDEV